MNTPELGYPECMIVSLAIVTSQQFFLQRCLRHWHNPISG